jgi:hypothetical protein
MMMIMMKIMMMMMMTTTPVSSFLSPSYQEYVALHQDCIRFSVLCLNNIPDYLLPVLWTLRSTMVDKLSIVMYLSIRRNKNLRVEIMLLFCRDIARHSSIYGYVRQVTMIVENNLPLQSRREKREKLSFNRGLALIFADKTLSLGNMIAYSTQLSFKNYL